MMRRLCIFCLHIPIGMLQILVTQPSPSILASFKNLIALITMADFIPRLATLLGIKSKLMRFQRLIAQHSGVGNTAMGQCLRLSGARRRECFPTNWCLQELIFMVLPRVFMKMTLMVMAMGQSLASILMA